MDMREASKYPGIKDNEKLKISERSVAYISLCWWKIKIPLMAVEDEMGMIPWDGATSQGIMSEDVTCTRVWEKKSDYNVNE